MHQTVAKCSNQISKECVWCAKEFICLVDNNNLRNAETLRLFRLKIIWVKALSSDKGNKVMDLTLV